MKKFRFAFFAAVCALLFSGCSSFNRESPMNSYDFSQMELVQLKEPKDGQPIAHIETTIGTITIVLYPEYAPKTVDNFINRANEGFYNNKPVFAVVNDIYFLTGSDDEDGKIGFTNDGLAIPNEYSVNLWPFRGAVLSYHKIDGYGDSRFFIIGAADVTKEEYDELREITDANGNQRVPDELVDAFIEYGAVPNLSATYTVFGQTIEGFDVLEEILSVDIDERTYRPIEDIRLVKVEISEYKSAG